MPRPIRDTMPTTLEEWNELCENAAFNSQEEYDQKVAAEKAAIQANWDKELPEKRNKAIAEVDERLANAMYEAEDGQILPFTEEMKQQAREAAIKEIDDKLNEELQRNLENAAISVEQPIPLEQWQATYASYKPQENPEPVEEPPAVDPAEGYYRLDDGRIYSVADQDFIDTSTRAAVPPYVIDVPGGTEQALREGILEFYGKTDPRIVVGYPLLSLEEAKTRRISEIDAQTSKNIHAGFAFTPPVATASEGGENTEAKTYYVSLKDNDQINLANHATFASLFVNMRIADQTITWQAWPTPVRDSPDIEPVTLSFTPQSFMAFYQEAIYHIQNCLNLGRAQKELVRKATDKETVIGVPIPKTDVVAIMEGVEG